jgi:hypothetical protein
VKSIFDFVKQFSMFAALAIASGGSALSRQMVPAGYIRCVN